MAGFWFVYINEHRRNIDLKISNLLLLIPARRAFSTRFWLRFAILILVAVTIGFALGLYLLTYRLGLWVHRFSPQSMRRNRFVIGDGRTRAEKSTFRENVWLGCITPVGFFFEHPLAAQRKERHRRYLDLRHSSPWLSLRHSDDHVVYALARLLGLRPRGFDQW